MKSCRECPFCYAEEGEKYPYCHFEARTFWDVPPCEEEDENNEEEPF